MLIDVNTYTMSTLIKDDGHSTCTQEASTTIPATLQCYTYYLESNDIKVRIMTDYNKSYFDVPDGSWRSYLFTRIGFE